MDGPENLKPYFSLARVCLVSVVCGVVMWAGAPRGWQGEGALAAKRRSLPAYKWTSRFSLIWNDRGSGAKRNVSLYRPVPPSGYVSLGDVARGSYGPIRGRVRVVPRRAWYVRFPTGFRRVWFDKGSGARWDGAIWTPRCPHGYHSVGMLATRHWRPPARSAIACLAKGVVRTVKMRYARLLWSDRGSGAAQDVSLWSRPGSGLFVAHRSYKRPTFRVYAPATTRQTRKRPKHSRRKKLLLIGIDGCKAKALKAARTPTLDALWRGGSYHFHGKTGRITLSGPGWSSMLTGVWLARHGVTGNNFRQARFQQYPHFFQRLKAVRPHARTVSLVHWKPIQQFIVSHADVNRAFGTDQQVLQAAQKELTQQNPDALFVHFDQVDHTGHASGFSASNPAYRQAIENVDTLVGKLLTTLRKRRSYRQEDWLIVVSTDHGGSGRKHGPDIPENRRIFMLFHGPGVKKGRLPSAPGIVDIAPTVLRHLGVKIAPSWRLDGSPLPIWR